MRTLITYHEAVHDGVEPKSIIGASLLFNLDDHPLSGLNRHEAPEEA